MFPVLLSTSCDEPMETLVVVNDLSEDFYIYIVGRDQNTDSDYIAKHLRLLSMDDSYIYSRMRLQINMINRSLYESMELENLNMRV